MGKEYLKGYMSNILCEGCAGCDGFRDGGLEWKILSRYWWLTDFGQGWVFISNAEDGDLISKVPPLGVHFSYIMSDENSRSTLLGGDNIFHIRIPNI